MASVFCTNCGGKHEYQGFAPNFCSKCGNPMNAKAAVQNTPNTQYSVAKKAVAKPVRREDIEDSSDDNTDIDEIPQIDKLDVDIEMEGGFKSFDLESLARAGNQAQIKRFSSRRVSGIDGLSPTKYGSRKESQED